MEHYLSRKCCKCFTSVTDAACETDVYDGLKDQYNYSASLPEKKKKLHIVISSFMPMMR